MSEEPQFSVVIPAYNRARTVAKAIRSVLSQDYAPREILVVDDGSLDDTAAAVEAFGDRVRLIRQTNQGASEARNRGVREAVSPWIAFLDSDDYWCEGHLRRMAAAIRGTGGRAGVYFANLRYAPEEGGELLWTMCGFEPAAPFELREDAASWVLGPFVPMLLQASVFDRRVYLEMGGLRADLRCRHDTHLCLLLCVGRPACAVTGCGAEMTSEDTSGGRVTASHGPAKPGYARETIAMYEDLLSRDYPFESAQASRVRAHIAAAHIQLARFDRHEGNWAGAFGHLVRAFVRHPGRFLSGLTRWSLAPLRRAPAPAQSGPGTAGDGS